MIDCIRHYTSNDTFILSFFPNILNKWNELNTNICLLKPYPSFKKETFQKIRLAAEPTFNVHNTTGLKSLTQLW